jgi:predicted SprT family Zn-dependent metalloprotease
MNQAKAATYNINLDLFEQPAARAAKKEPPAPELPSLDELRRMFDIYNEKYFEGKLPRVTITYSGKMMVAGGYYPTRREIRISEKYHHIFPDEVFDTLKHEMIHIIHFKHDAVFREMAKQIGASVRANEHPSLRKPPKYVYICPGCFVEYPRHKRLRMASCGKCSKGGFDPRYKLVIKPRPRKGVIRLPLPAQP